MRMPIDRPSKWGYVLLPLAAPHHRREGLVHERPSTQGAGNAKPSPGGGRGNNQPRMKLLCQVAAAWAPRPMRRAHGVRRRSEGPWMGNVWTSRPVKRGVRGISGLRRPTGESPAMIVRISGAAFRAAGFRGAAWAGGCVAARGFRQRRGEDRRCRGLAGRGSCGGRRHRRGGA